MNPLLHALLCSGIAALSLASAVLISTPITN